jgi:hypothetical protein
MVEEHSLRPGLLVRHRRLHPRAQGCMRQARAGTGHIRSKRLCSRSSTCGRSSGGEAGRI